MEYTLSHICNFHQVFDFANIKPIENISRNKPKGGLWLSVNNGWEKWCESEMPEWLIGTRYAATLKPDARICWVYDEEDLEALPNNPKAADVIRMFGDFEKFIDFEALTKDYDAIAVMVQSGDWNCLYNRLYGWDCDSMVVFHPEIIESIEETTSWAIPEALYDGNEDW